MPFLVVGGQTIEVVATGAEEQQGAALGEHARAGGGRLGGYVRYVAGEYRFQSYDLTPAAWEALVAASPPGRRVACSGDALAAGGDYFVRRSARIVWDPVALDARYVATLDLQAAF